MKNLFKAFFTVIIVIAGVASFLFLCLRNRDTLGEYYARSSINVEIEPQYAGNIAISIESASDPYSYWLSPTTEVNHTMRTVMMHRTIPLKRPFWNPAIQFPETGADAALNAIDNVAFFVGNKLFYFSHDEVQRFRREVRDGYARFYIPDIRYEQSMVFKNWSNYYGDLNFGIKALTAFLLYPGRFIPVYLLLGLLLFIYRKQLASLYAAMAGKKITGILLFMTVVAGGFILRWNGYARHSGWTDEIYSATQAGNPVQPFISTFMDPGNPPFYFMLLRWWFQLFGWSEETGTMLSVVLGTFSIAALYFLIKPFFGRKTALCAALFVAFSGFSIGYSQEMRAYILLMAIAPLISLALLAFITKPSAKNLVFYTLPAIAIVNTHFYGILFIMANFFFYVALTLYRRQWQWKNALLFSAGNLIAALSFLPYFLYMLLVRGNDFSRDFSPSPGHFFIVLVILSLAAVFISRKELAKTKLTALMPQPEQTLFFAYLVLIPVFIFILAFGISFIKPMISFRYLWPISAPYCFALAAVGIFCMKAANKWRFVAPLLVYAVLVGLYGLFPDIPGGGVEGYKQARAYIAADASVHPERTAAMLDNAPANAAYYGFPDLPLYNHQIPPDVLYVFNDAFTMHEIDMYEDLRELNLDDGRMLKVFFDFEYPRGDGNVVFKYMLK